MGVNISKQFALGIDVSLSDDFHLNRDLCLVAHSAIEEFGSQFSVLPPAGVRRVSILYRSQGPVTDSTSDTTRYRVYLSVKDRYYAKLVYQLGHELCHIFADPRRTNWFVESCCEMSALILLRRASRRWRKNPPYSSWSSYAPEFERYAQNRIRQANEAEEPNDRQRNAIVAEMLCPLFEESAESWDTLCFLGRAFTPPPVDLADWNPNLLDFSFDRWEQAVPECLRSVVARMCEAFRARWHEFDCSHPLMPL